MNIAAIFSLFIVLNHQHVSVFEFFPSEKQQWWETFNPLWLYVQVNWKHHQKSSFPSGLTLWYINLQMEKYSPLLQCCMLSTSACDMHSQSFGKPLLTHLDTASKLYMQDVCINCKLLCFNFIWPAMTSNSWYKTFTISHPQGWPMVYWPGNVCCSKISWHFQAFQTCLEMHDSNQHTYPGRPLQCPLADMSYFRMCDMLDRYLAHGWYYQKSLDKAFKWKQLGSQKHGPGWCWSWKGLLTPLNPTAHFPGEETQDLCELSCPKCANQLKVL